MHFTLKEMAALFYAAGRRGQDLDEAFGQFIVALPELARPVRVTQSQMAILDALAVDGGFMIESSEGRIHLVGGVPVRLVVDGNEEPCDMLATVLEAEGYTEGAVNILAIFGFLGAAGAVITEYLRQFHPADVDRFDLTWRLQKIERDLAWFRQEQSAIGEGRKPLHVPQPHPLFCDNYSTSRMLDTMAEKFYWTKAVLGNLGYNEQTLAQLALLKSSEKKGIISGQNPAETTV